MNFDRVELLLLRVALKEYQLNRSPMNKYQGLIKLVLGKLDDLLS